MVAFLYNVSLCILLLHLVINIAILIRFLMNAIFGISIAGLLLLDKVVGFFVTIFQGFFLGFGSLARVFLFIKDIFFKGYLINSFALCFNLLIYYNLLKTIICSIYIAPMQKYFVILRLYLIKTFFQIFW